MKSLKKTIRVRKAVKAQAERVDQARAEYEDIKVKLYRRGLSVMVTVLQEYQSKGSFSPNETLSLLTKVKDNLIDLDLDSTPPQLAELQFQIEEDIAQVEADAN